MTYTYSNFYNQNDYLHLVLYNRKPGFLLVKSGNACPYCMQGGGRRGNMGNAQKNIELDINISLRELHSCTL